MTIETKFDIDQEVWLIHDNKAIKTVVNNINIYSRYDGGIIKTSIIYDLRFISGSSHEENLFLTKEELLKSL